MKKVLVTGASGIIGKCVIKYLLSEGKYEITIVDLKNHKSTQALRKYRKRVNIVYGDITDSILVDALVRDHDYIINFPGLVRYCRGYHVDIFEYAVDAFECLNKLYCCHTQYYQQYYTCKYQKKMSYTFQVQSNLHNNTSLFLSCPYYVTSGK